MPAIIYILIVIWLFTLLMMVRNNLVYNWRRELIEFIFSKDDYIPRMQKYNDVSYNQMMYQFWKPLKAKYFWKDTSFLQD